MGSTVRLLTGRRWHRTYPHLPKRPGRRALTSRSTIAGFRGFAPRVSCAGSPGSAPRGARASAPAGCRGAGVWGQKPPADWWTQLGRRDRARRLRPTRRFRFRRHRARAGGRPRPATPRVRIRPEVGGRSRSMTRRRSSAVLPGVATDTGGTGKGLAADAVAHRLSGYCGSSSTAGATSVGGPACSWAPYEIEVEHPLARDRVRSLVLRSGGIATSGLSSRIWEDGRGRLCPPPARPVYGRPAWTGLVAVTALAPTALEAETSTPGELYAAPRARASCSWVGVACSSGRRPCRARGWLAVRSAARATPSERAA